MMFNTNGLQEEEIDQKAWAEFSAAMSNKLMDSRYKGRGGWYDQNLVSNEQLSEMLIDHIRKGQAVDVANFAMMLWHREGGENALANVAQQMGGGSNDLS